MPRPMTPSTRADRMYTAVVFGIGAAFVAYGGGIGWSLFAVLCVATGAAAWELSQPWRDARRVSRHGDLPRKPIPGILRRSLVYCVVLAIGIWVTVISAASGDIADLDGTIWAFGAVLLTLFAISGLELQFLRRRNRARAMGPQPIR